MDKTERFVRGSEFVHIICQKNICTGCAACANSCPKGCIHMEADGEGFLYPRIDADACVECGLCEKVCPINGEMTVNSLKCAFAAYHANPQIRARSSSGGVFTAIAEEVLNKGGVVFGACFDEKLRVVHGYTETVEGLAAFRGSKYVQSEIGDSYRRVRDFLKKGRLALFSGTPCQIGGLLAYLGTDYENLICQDIICHGVPSPLVWGKYLESQTRKYRGLPMRASFRDKRNGWSRYSVYLQFGNGKNYIQPARKDGFMKAFLGDFCLRPSCYNCSFKREERQADITLADFWGADQVVPEMNDDRGLSLVLVHSQKGDRLLEKAVSVLEHREVAWVPSVALNPAINHSAAVPTGRTAFMNAIVRENFGKVVRKYCDPSVSQRIKAFGSRLLRGPAWLKRKLLNRIR